MHVLRHGAESRLNVLRYAMHVLRYGAETRRTSRCIKMVMHVLRYGIGCSGHCSTDFGTVRFFRKKNLFVNFFLQALPYAYRSLPTARKIITARINKTPADTVLIQCSMKRGFANVLR